MTRRQCKMQGSLCYTCCTHHTHAKHINKQTVTLNTHTHTQTHTYTYSAPNLQSTERRSTVTSCTAHPLGMCCHQGVVVHDCQVYINTSTCIAIGPSTHYQLHTRNLTLPHTVHYQASYPHTLLVCLLLS